MDILVQNLAAGEVVAGLGEGGEIEEEEVGELHDWVVLILEVRELMLPLLITQITISLPSR